jgi:DNA-3-methyladenine glycosylase II
MPRIRAELVEAVEHLRAADRVLGTVIDRVGPCTLVRRRDRFRSLVDSIVSQQISGKAAASILARLETTCGPPGVTASALRTLGPDGLRTCVISPQKAGYLLDLCAHVDDGRLVLDRVGRWSDERVVEELVRVKGIGRWTAQMFLIFSLGRLDVLPHDDLGVRAALRRLYGLADLPDRATCEEIARPWRPFASVASWYCWRSGDLRDGTD